MIAKRCLVPPVFIDFVYYKKYNVFMLNKEVYDLG